MRTPKYKAFYKPHNYIYHVTDMNFEGTDYTLREVKLSNGIWLRSDKLDDIILLEQTPLTDKNGDYIYEGDICKLVKAPNMDFIKDKKPFEVRYGKGAQFYGYVDGWLEDVHLYDLENYEYEVLGNIHKNPELISKTPTYEH